MLSKEKAPDSESNHGNIPRRASTYTDEQLAEIYNQTRVDYIVPMPMNAKRMRHYIDTYDIDLDASVIALDAEDDEPNGLCMLGVRGDRTWITRLGVIPERRRRYTGRFLMDAMVEMSLAANASRIQLEVIKGNEPAHKLFLKYGFEVQRDLHIIRRAPAAIEMPSLPDFEMTTLEEHEVFDVLNEREVAASWVEEAASLRNAGSMTGYRLHFSDGESGWIVFQKTSFQLSHFALKPNISKTMMRALIATVHQQNPLQDTKIENVPDQHPTWPIFQELGYHIAFSRIEMFRQL